MGVINRILFFFTQSWVSDAGAVVFLSMLAICAVFAEVTFNAILISLCRDLPIALILITLIFKITSRKPLK